MIVYSHSLQIHSAANLANYFYDGKVQEAIRNIQQFLNPQHQLHLFPEATIKNNKLPNGILIKSPVNQTCLLYTSDAADE